MINASESAIERVKKALEKERIIEKRGRPKSLTLKKEEKLKVDAIDYKWKRWINL